MAYEKINFVNEPEDTTPVSAENLNHMEDGIYNAQAAADHAQADVDNLNERNLAPVPVSLASEMTEQGVNYLYLGSEDGYDNGYLYYINAQGVLTRGNEYQAVELITDPTLSGEGQAADAKATGDAVNGLKNAFNAEYVDDVTTLTPTTQSGYMAKNGVVSASSSYVYTEKIEVDEGDVVVHSTSQNGPTSMRFICAFNGDTVVSDAGSDSIKTKYTVPSGITHVVLSVPVSAGAIYYVFVKKKKLVSSYIEKLLKNTFPCIGNASFTVQTGDFSSSQVTMVTGDRVMAIVPCIYGAYYDVDRTVGNILRIGFVKANTVSVGTTVYDFANLDYADGKTTVYVEDEDYRYILLALATNKNTYSVASVRAGLTVKQTWGNADYELRRKLSAPYDCKLTSRLASLTANTLIKLADHLDNKKNCDYAFSAEFESFTKVVIGHGTNEYQGIYMEIDGTTMKTYNAYTGEVMSTANHGLTISDVIKVNIAVANNDSARATVTIITNNGSFSTSNIFFNGCNGAIYAKGSQNMTNVAFTYTLKDAQKDVYVFGDSYISLADANRWPYYALEAGDKNMLLCGFSGANSANVILSFRELMEISKPKMVAWFIGMNDSDSGAVNASWKSCVEEVMEYCDANGIELVLATIPNTPITDNTYKNAYVKASGYRYVDFAESVGASDASSTWYGGMLSGDNLHPTALGAKTLYNEVLLDMPEISLVK